VKRPWNLVNQPVYSLATYLDGTVNMNICTYVTAVSMKPKQYAIGVYYDTYTLERLEKGANAVLQLLSIDHLMLIKKLGKTSGRKLDKTKWLKDRGLLGKWKEFTVLKDACAFLELDYHSNYNTGGDHELFIYNIKSSSSKKDSGILHLQDLIDHQLIL